MSNINQDPTLIQELWPGLGKVVAQPGKYVSIVPASTNKNNHNDLRRTFRSYMDPQRQYTFGIPINVNREKKIYVFNKIVIDGSQMYNLGNLSEAREFAIVEQSPFVVGSPNAAFHIPAVFKVLDEEKEAAKSVNIFQKIVLYGEKIGKMAKQDVSDLALVVFGTAAIKNSHTTNLNLLFSELQKNPAKVIATVDNNAKSEVQAIFNRGLATRMIIFRKETGYTTEYGALLGYDTISAMAKLDSQPELLRTIDYESRRKQGIQKDDGRVATAQITEESTVEEVIRRAHTEDGGMDAIGMLHSENEASKLNFADEMANMHDNDNAFVQDVAVPNMKAELDESLMGRDATEHVDSSLVDSLIEQDLATVKKNTATASVFDDVPKPKVKAKAK